MASYGQLTNVQPQFGNHNSVENAGVLVLLPALLGQGLMTIKKTHQISNGYYGLETIVLTLAFMILCRIKNPEQLKQCSPGEMGKLLGIDRIPEMRCLRKKMKELFSNETSKELNNLLAKEWLETETDDVFLYTDGHVRIYNGHLANPTKKYVSRQKLCLPATTDFWLNDEQGMPLMVFSGELSEKLQFMIEQTIIPELYQSEVISATKESQEPICTIIFDREAYEPSFFSRLWLQHRIAIITYRKNVKEYWQEQEFVPVDVVDNVGNKNTLRLCEKEIELNGHTFREIRNLSANGHQTAIITTHNKLSMDVIAVKMFNRWVQVNFFKYMIADYSIDHIVQYGVEEIDPNKDVVNPEYRKIKYQIKKEKEKLQRLKAQLLKQVKLSVELNLDDLAKTISIKEDIISQINLKENTVKELVEKKAIIAPRLKLHEMKKGETYTKLKDESYRFMATLKMICYRAESVTAFLLDEIYSRYDEEKRMFIKKIIKSSADIKTDYKNNTLTITLHSMDTPNKNKIIKKLLDNLNDSETIFPGTNLRLIYKSIAD